MCHLNLHLGVLYELVSIFTFLHMLSLAKIIERIPDVFNLTYVSASEVILEELGVDCASVVLFFVLILHFSISAELCRRLSSNHHPIVHP